MIQQAALPKPPPVGQYTPPCDVLTYTAGHKVRQIRRVQSFAKNFMSARRSVSRQFPQHQLVQEWTAILRARGYHMSFKNWILKHLGHCPCEINDITHEWLLTLEHRLKGDSDRYHARMNQYRKSDFTEKIQVDWKEHGGKFTCAMLKPSSRPPADTVTHPETCSATRVRTRKKCILKLG